MAVGTHYSMTVSTCAALLGLSLATACATAGSDDDDDIIVVVDASTPDSRPGQTPDATPDAAPLGAPCDPILQDCEVEQKCALIITDVAAQTGYSGCAVNGNKSPGQACTNASAVDTADDCILGSHCVFSTCHAICNLDTTPCTDGACIGVNNLEMQFDICLPSCNPVSPTCAAGEGCYLTSTGSGVCAPPVNPPGVGPHGACSALNDCEPGSGCFNPGTCLVYCDYSIYPGQADPRCPSGEVCGPVTGQPVVGACN